MASTVDRGRDRKQLLENFVRIAIEGRQFSHAVVARQEAVVDARSGMLPPSSSQTVTVDCDRCGDTPLTHWFSHASQLYGRSGVSGQTTVDLCGACCDDVRRLATEIVPTRGDLLKRVRQLSAPRAAVEPPTATPPTYSSSSSSSSASVLASLTDPAVAAAAAAATATVVPPSSLSAVPPLPSSAPSSTPWPPFIPSGVATHSPMASSPHNSWFASASFWPPAPPLWPSSVAPAPPPAPSAPLRREPATSGERHVWPPPPPSPCRNTGDSLFLPRTSAVHRGDGDGGSRW